MSSLDRPMNDCGGSSPFRLLWNSGAINPQWILVHLNELDEEDFQLLAELPRGGGPHVVHCPGSHRYFAHAPFSLQRLRSLGVNVCVGTDSLASTNSLSLLSELRTLRAVDETLSAEELLRMITVNPARALRRKGKLGQIVPGALADLIALPLSRSVPALYDAIVDYDRPIPWMMIDGTIRS
jgi:cytosine/adenosine deaminase-related metal-dependent hydrolase